MIVYLYGADSYRRGERLRAILAEYSAKYSNLTISHFDGDDPELLGKLRDFGTHQSLFGDRKIGVLRGADLAPDEAAPAVAPMAEMKGVTLAVVAEKKLGAAWDFLENSKRE